VTGTSAPLPPRSAAARLVQPWPAAGFAVLVACLAVWTGPIANHDWANDWANDWVGGGAGSLRAGLLVVPALALGGFAALHYVASACTLRAASGADLPWREACLSQLSASSANRVTPGGLGGAALNVRYLTRRGVTPLRALGAVAAMPVVGAAADLGVFALVLLAGAWAPAGRSSPWSLLAGVAARAGRLLVAHPWVDTAVAALAAAVAALVFRRARRHGARGPRELLAELTDLRRRPRDLAVMAAASAGTTLVLGCAMVATLSFVVGPAVLPRTLPLLTAFLLGAAVGSAVPVPGGVGSTDAALAASLVAAGIHVGQAVQAVLIFRVVTFWAPAALGVLAARHLRRAGAY